MALGVASDDPQSALVALLETGIAAHASGDFSAFEATADQFEAAYGSYDGELGDWLHYVRYFVDCWIDAHNHEWQYHAPVGRGDWVPLAQAIATDIGNEKAFSIPTVNGVSLAQR